MPLPLRSSLALLLFALSGAAPPEAATRLHAGTRAYRSAHDLHLTHTRMVVAQSTVTCRVRLFRDDLERALGTFARRDSLRVASSPASDSIFQAYWNDRVKIVVDGEPVSAIVARSGRDPEALDAEMWWYDVVLRAPRDVQAITVQLGLLFELFSDQRNLVTVIRMPGEERHSLYFAGNDDKPKTVRF